MFGLVVLVWVAYFRWDVWFAVVVLWFGWWLAGGLRGGCWLFVPGWLVVLCLVW